MSDENLRQLLVRVHESLKQGPSVVDPESRALLLMVKQDIERTLGTSSSPSGELAAAPEASLETLAVRFEADHPHIAQTLRQLIDSLRQAGI